MGKVASSFQRWMRGLGVLLAIAIGVTLQSSSQAADDLLEYRVKAAFLLNFTKFVEWPATAFESADSPVAICIFGENPFGDALDRMVEGETASGRKVRVEAIKRLPEPKMCQVVFVSEPGKSLKSPTDLPPGALTVGEGRSFVREGGMIGFVIENRRVRFEINETAAEHAGIKLSSKLLNVARSVEK